MESYENIQKIDCEGKKHGWRSKHPQETSKQWQLFKSCKKRFITILLKSSEINTNSVKMLSFDYYGLNCTFFLPFFQYYLDYAGLRWALSFSSWKIIPNFYIIIFQDFYKQQISRLIEKALNQFLEGGEKLPFYIINLNLIITVNMNSIRKSHRPLLQTN